MSVQSLLMRLAERYRVTYRDATLPSAIQIAARDGLRLNYLDWHGAGETIVFLHGGALTAHSWDLVCLGLRDEWRCLALDLRGHGDSGWASEYSVETSVEDVAAVVTQERLPRIHIVGMSLGGMIAAHYAASYGHAVASLTLVDVGPRVNFVATQTIRNYVADTDGVATLDAAIDAGIAVNPRIDRDALEYRLLHSMHRRDDLLHWKQDRRRAHDYDYILGKLAEIEQFSSQITVPVLVVRGERSRVFTDADAQACAAGFPNGQWARVADAGHNIQEANPAGMIEALREFLTKAPDERQN